MAWIEVHQALRGHRKTLALRRQLGMESDAQVIGQAPNGATVTINGEWQGWDVISYNGIVGYVDSSYIV